MWFVLALLNIPSASVISPAVLSFSHITAASVSAWGDESTAEFSATVPLSETTLKKHSDHWVYKRSNPNHKTPSSPRFQRRNDKNTGPAKICSALFLGDGTLVPNGAMTPLGQAQNWSGESQLQYDGLLPEWERIWTLNAQYIKHGQRQEEHAGPAQSSWGHILPGSHCPPYCTSESGGLPQ